MKGLFPRLQHRSLQSMNDLFSLLNQTQCCHFHDPKKQPNIQTNTRTHARTKQTKQQTTHQQANTHVHAQTHTHTNKQHKNKHAHTSTHVHAQAANMKGLFPRLQHRSLLSMNDLFSLLNQTQCCHFLDPKKHPNMEKRGYQSMFFILIEMINLLFLQKHSIQSDEMCSLSIDPFYRLSYC